MTALAVIAAGWATLSALTALAAATAIRIADHRDYQLAGADAPKTVPAEWTQVAA